MFDDVEQAESEPMMSAARRVRITSRVLSIGISLGLEFQEIETLTKQRIAGDNFDFRTGDKSSVGGML